MHASLRAIGLTAGCFLVELYSVAWSYAQRSWLAVLSNCAGSNFACQFCHSLCACHPQPLEYQARSGPAPTGGCYGLYILLVLLRFDNRVSEHADAACQRSRAACTLPRVTQAATCSALRARTHYRLLKARRACAAEQLRVGRPRQPYWQGRKGQQLKCADYPPKGVGYMNLRS